MPLCVLLTLVRRLQDVWSYITGRPSRDREKLGPDPCVVIVKLSEMGSTVLAVPALQRLCRLHPGAKLYYVCFDENRAVLDILPGIRWEAVHTIRTGSLLAVLRDSWRVMLQLRKLKPDVAIDLEVFSRASAALIFASGATWRVGFHRFRAEGMNCGDLFTHRLSYNSHLHTTGAFLAMVEALAADAGDLPLLKQIVRTPEALAPFEPAESQRQSVLAKLRQRGCPVGESPPIVLLNANTSDLLPLRKWPTERFEELARRCLMLDEHIWVVLTGAAKEASAIEALRTRIGQARVISMAGQTTLSELLALYHLGRVLVTNDSGPVHFAALTPISVVALFGPETPNLYGPLGKRHTSITARLACSPCIHVYNARATACKNNLCMQAITVDEVFSAVRESLEAQGLGADAVADMR